MIRQSLILMILSLFALALPASVEASMEADQSAQLRPFYGVSKAKADEILRENVQETVIRSVLQKQNSPLADEADQFVVVARALDLDPYLLPAITGVESTFAQFMIPGTYNPFGYGKGTIKFDSWGDGIAKVGYALRYRYIDRGARSLSDIGHMYASGSDTWAPKVARLMGSFDKEEAKIMRYYELL